MLHNLGPQLRAMAEGILNYIKTTNELFTVNVQAGADMNSDLMQEKMKESVGKMLSDLGDCPRIGSSTGMQMIKLIGESKLRAQDRTSILCAINQRISMEPAGSAMANKKTGSSKYQQHYAVQNFLAKTTWDLLESPWVPELKKCLAITSTAVAIGVLEPAETVFVHWSGLIMAAEDANLLQKMRLDSIRAFRLKDLLKSSHKIEKKRSILRTQPLDPLPETPAELARRDRDTYDKVYPGLGTVIDRATGLGTDPDPNSLGAPHPSRVCPLLLDRLREVLPARNTHSSIAQHFARAAPRRLPMQLRGASHMMIENAEDDLPGFRDLRGMGAGIDNVRSYLPNHRQPALPPIADAPRSTPAEEGSQESREPPRSEPGMERQQEAEVAAAPLGPQGTATKYRRTNQMGKIVNINDIYICIDVHICLYIYKSGWSN